jgi:hypothetical protein
MVTIIRRVSSDEYPINDQVFAQPAVANRVLKEFRELAVDGQEAAPTRTAAVCAGTMQLGATSSPLLNPLVGDGFQDIPLVAPILADAMGFGRPPGGILDR